MDQTVRLYKLHDFDLVYLQKVLNFPIKDAMKMALKAYIRNEPVFLKIPVTQIDTKTEQEALTMKSVQFHLMLDEVEDDKEIAYLKNIKKNMRNSFLKNLLRGYLAGPVGYVYESMNKVDDTQNTYKQLEDNILGIKSLKPLPKRGKRKKHIVLTTKQKELFDLTGALDDVEVIVNDRDSNKGK